jgi:L-lactate utilization protein LutC
MNLFKKIFQQKPTVDETTDTAIRDTSNLALDDAFVQNFIHKGGKFLYCTHQEEVNQNLAHIINENHWEKVVCINDDLKKIITIIGEESTTEINNAYPFFTNCEHLISEDGSILFSSEQVREKKIADLPEHFIVFANTSQLVRNKSEGLMGLRKTYRKNFPTNISSIKSYIPERVDEDFLSFGNNNAKSLYLLLLEDL